MSAFLPPGRISAIMSSASKSSPSQTARRNAYEAVDYKTPSQTMPRQRREYFPAVPGLPSAKAQDVDSGVKRFQGDIGGR